MLSPEVLRAYRRRLTNLSSRNRSLLLTSLPAEQFADLHEADFLLNKPSFELIRQLIARREAIPVCDRLDSRSEKVNRFSRRLRQIARTDRFIAEERGTRDLYVCYPFVRGMLSDGTVIHAPLVFFPVRMELSEERWRLSVRPDEPVTLNRSFLLAYAHYNGMKLPEDLLELTLDDFERDATAFRTQLYERLKESPLAIRFNPDLFTDKLDWFNPLKKAELETLERPGELSLYPEAVLGIFPQTGSYLAPDYDHLLENRDEGLTDRRIEGFGAVSMLPQEPNAALSTSPEPAPALADHPSLHQSINPSILKEELLHTPLPVDASQEAVIRQVKAGASLVVQGPPGTGKSQLIANLMADFAARGKRVLLVCQKRAALDVVYQRLSGVGMAPFTALIHDFRNDRRALYEQLAAQIEQVEAYQRQNQGLDAILLERTFDQESRRIDQALAELQEFKEALFDESDCGVSVKELYLTSDPTAPSIPMGDDFRRFRIDEGEAFGRRLRDLQAYQARIGSDHPWYRRVSFARFTPADQAAIRQTLDEAVASVQELTARTQALFGNPLSWAKAAQLYFEAGPLTRLADRLGDPILWNLVSRFNSGKLAEQDAIRAGKNLYELEEAHDNGLVFSKVPFGEMPAVLDRLRRGLEARDSWLGWLLYRDKPFVIELTSREGLTTEPDDLRLLLMRIEQHRHWYQRLEALTNALHLPSLLEADPALTVENVFHLHQVIKRALEANQHIQGRFPFLLAWLRTLTSAADFRAGLEQLVGWLQDIHHKQERWQQYLIYEQLERLVHEPEAVSALMQQTLEADFDWLVEADRLRADLTPTENAIVDRLARSGQPDWAAVFANSLRLAWISQIESRHPVLRSVSSLRMNQLEATLQESILQKQALSQQILGIRLREQTYRDLSFNRLNNRVTYRDLNHQVTKKRNIWPIRKLLETFADEVFQLVPCWMASPEAVSALFPMQPGLFDLVVFDEASQCYAETGIPALYRARHVVVTGDSRQLPPGDLYRIRYEPEPAEDAPVELEVESLLDLATHYFAPATLRGHYRSRSPELIDFSNQHFYRNRLQLLPDFLHLNDREPAIRYCRVDGIWQEGTNEVEARAVVDLIQRLQREQPGRSVGVVTFNYPQQQLIQEMLENGGIERGEAEEWLFVKNIENVQGDERDVIIFSVGYAPDAKGKVTAQFGSLNTKGGENRLNVAVTRARERIYVVTSLSPEQLPVDNTANEGPKLLRRYLEFACRVSKGQYRPIPHQPEGVPGSRLLKDRLRENVPGLAEELPFADLTRKADGRYLGLLLTDDALYFESPVKEAHAYGPLALRAKNWPFERVYSREVWRGRSIT